MKINFIFAWYDFWIGFFWDKKRRWLYVLPIPMVGIVLKFGVQLPADYNIEVSKTFWVGEEGKIETFTVFYKNEQSGAFKTREEAFNQIWSHNRYFNNQIE